MLNFYQINKNSKIRTRDSLIIKTLTSNQKTFSMQQLICLQMGSLKIKKKIILLHINWTSWLKQLARFF
jgi:hypothetical protein